MSTNIYILKLEGGRYYVGKTGDVVKRFQEHLDGDGSSWTRKYRPLSLEKSISGASPFEEDKVTKEYMAKYGIDRVRGGSYVTETLSDDQRSLLRAELRSAGDCCTRCGRKGHFVTSCSATSHVEGDVIEVDTWGCETCDREFADEASCAAHERACGRSARNVVVLSGGSGCYRCGRAGHYVSDCYARTTVRGELLDSDSDNESESESEEDDWDEDSE